MAAAEGSSTSGSPRGPTGSPLPRTTSSSPAHHSTTTPSPPQSARAPSPVQESGASAYSYCSAPSGSASGSGSGASHHSGSLAHSHRTPTPVSPQYTFGGHTPLSPQSFASGTPAIMPTPLAVPDGDELSIVLEGEREIDLGTPPSDSPEPRFQQQHHQYPEAGPSTSYAPRAGTPDSVGSGALTQRSTASSWQYHESRSVSAAAINIAHKQRVSQAPPLPDQPYTAPPSATNRPLTPTGATSLLAAAASSIATPSVSATRLTSSTMGGSIRRQVSRTGAKSPPENDPDAPPVPSLPQTVVYTPTAGPSVAAELKAAISAGEAPPHYAFLDQDPTQSEDNSPPHGGVMTFSGGDRRPANPVTVVQGSASASPARKHLSFQSQHSEAFAYSGYGTSSSMADVGDSSGSGSGSQTGKTDRTVLRLSAQSLANQWSSFAGGPAPTWGKRESNRASGKSYKSGRSVRSRNGKRRSNGNPLDAAGRGSNDSEEWVDDDEADLMALMRRAAVLERLLRHGKRASNMAANPRMVARYSHWSIASTSLSNLGMSRAPTSRSRSGSPEKWSQSPPPPRRSASSATTHTHRSKRSATSSLRHRLQRKLGMRGAGGFQDLGSDDGIDSTEPDMTVEGIDDGSSTSIKTPLTPIRRAFSTSFSQQRPSPSPGAGAGIIVFPELAALPPLEPPRHDGELCAQACLPPSVAVPYTPLPPPPEAKRDSRTTKSKHSSGGSDQGANAGTVGTQRSLHSLKNMRNVFDEKAGGGFSDNRASVHSATVLMGDVPTCDQRFGVRRARRMRVVSALACIVGIALIVGLLAGLLTRRNKQ